MKAGISENLSNLWGLARVKLSQLKKKKESQQNISGVLSFLKASTENSSVGQFPRAFIRKHPLGATPLIRCSTLMFKILEKYFWGSSCFSKDSRCRFATQLKRNLLQVIVKEFERKYRTETLQRTDICRTTLHGLLYT